MKTAFILIGFICFSFSANEKGAVNGIWQGAYGTDDRIETTFVEKLKQIKPIRIKAVFIFTMHLLPQQ